MNDNEQLLELITKMYVEMQNGFKSVNDKLDALDSRVTFIEKDHGAKLEFIEKDHGAKLTFIEQDHGDKLISLDKKLNSLDDKTTSLEVKFDDLNNKTISLEVKLDDLSNKIDSIEANNASRHVSMVSDINEIKTNISNIEIITAQNWADIARLKVGEKIDIKY